MTLLAVDDLYAGYGGADVVKGVSFSISANETLGLIGESGSGKSTLGKALVGLIPHVRGGIAFDGAPIGGAAGDRGAWRQHIQMVFQDPYGSLNPRRKIGAILDTPLVIHGQGDRRERQRRIQDILERVGLPHDAADRYPHEFSGGQRQRIGIARALILRPRLVICDEPTSALDLSVQAQILNLLSDIRREDRLSCLFISHDLAVVRYMADHILVMHGGRIVESGAGARIWEKPAHPYTLSLMNAASATLGARDRGVSASRDAGNLPSLQGCSFQAACPRASDVCRSVLPLSREMSPGHHVACHHPEE